MNKFLIMALFAIILVTAVTYDSYAFEYLYYPLNDLTQFNSQSNYDYFINKTETESFIYQIAVLNKNTSIISYFLFKDEIIFHNGDLKFVDGQNHTVIQFTSNYDLNVQSKYSVVYDGLSPRVTDISSNSEILYSNIIIYDIDSNIYYTQLPEPIPLPDEYLYITTPPEGHKNIDKFMTYNVMYKIAADQIADVKLNVRNEEGLPFGDDPDVISYNAVNHNATIENGYVSGTLQIMVDYQTTFVGPIGIQLDILNEVTNRQLSITRNVEIVAFVDADGDGIDDNTGQPLYDAEEAIVISSPAYGSRTVNRLVPLNFFIRIKASNVDSVLANTQILYQNPNTSIWENLLISDIMNNYNSNINNRNQLRLWNFYKNGEYITLNMTVNLLFADNFLGEVPFRIVTTSDTTGKQLITNHKINIVSFLDSNNDGIDDNTGEMYNPNPELPSYDDQAGSINDAIGTLQNVLPAITTSLATIVSLLTFIFGWLPVEIRVLMVTVMTLIGITTIVKVLRG